MNLKPQLVIDRDTGKVCVQLKLGKNVATLVLPEHLARDDEAELEAFFAAVVPEMTAKLHQMQRDDDRNFRRKLS